MKSQEEIQQSGDSVTHNKQPTINSRPGCFYQSLWTMLMLAFCDKMLSVLGVTLFSYNGNVVT